MVRSATRNLQPANNSKLQTRLWCFHQHLIAADRIEAMTVNMNEDATPPFRLRDPTGPIIAAADTGRHQVVSRLGFMRHKALKAVSIALELENLHTFVVA
ncbi:hypothetical protein FOC4_g10003737 [Fusarium odoratissimum]|uniref:Uncharacterized protein n=2 Tax=Fusarium oxysporum species complex TaxID=171631 RepID=N1RZ55_FUSC4|nr:hypothetical protein FOC4_g10003737 [Fusarium odoratissimum]TXB95933.1 hypothetical protein FocTR4_00016430 [Fusarium oxysporum f. sp. cubense]